MHLLIVNQYALPAGAPGITRHGDLGRELVRRGHRVTVIASRFNYLTRRETAGGDVETRDGVTFRWLDTGGYAGNDQRRVRSMVDYTLRGSWAGLRIRPGPDVVLGSSPHPLAGAAALAIARRFRVPFVYEIRDLWPSALVDLGAIRRGGLAHRGLELLERILYRSASRIITVQPKSALRVAELGVDPAKCVHIPNATTLTGEGDPLPESLDAILAAEGERFIVMYTGAHGVANGLDNIIDTADHLRAHDPATYGQLAFIFVGDGTERARLTRRARDAGHEHVHFHAPIAKASMPAALRRADVLLIHLADAPSFRYGLSPSKLSDYMAAGRPVLFSSHLDDTPLQQHQAGMTFEPGSPVALASAITHVLRLPEGERRAMGENGRRAAEAHYTIEATANQLEALLADVTSAPT
jgi:glycosyltransferase involved in cell wall biosynthesis